MIGSRKLKSIGKKSGILVLLAICISFMANKAIASDNVLQAIQVNGFKDSYNIILKSDDIAELKKTVQAPNKMIINLKGIRASKTINTIYNNTSSVDSVVVEPTGDDSVKILVQAQNVANAQVHFDSLKTPLGVLSENAPAQKAGEELVLNAPVSSYKPVYQESTEQEEGFSITNAMASPAIGQLKNILKNEKISWMITFGLFAIFVLSGIKTVKGKDNEIKIGLSQSLKQRELDLYREQMASETHTNILSPIEGGLRPTLTGANYGLKTYQNTNKSPYLSSEIQRQRPAQAPVVTNTPLVAQSAAPRSSRQLNQNIPSGMQTNTLQKTMPKAPQAINQKTANIDSMKFLESMTKIYEKSGRSDLAQGLKTNMKKAKVNLA